MAALARGRRMSCRSGMGRRATPISRSSGSSRRRVASGVEAIHPGYGFLSENAAFAEAAAAAGLIFVGPPPAAIRSMGSKSDAKRLMALAGVPVVPGYGGERQEPYFLKQKAYEIGYPVLIKAVAGGGGRGMRRVATVIDFDDALASAKREALSAFGDDQVLLERYVETPRHIEVQVFADRHGNIVHLFERDCSVQRRHQKVIEEAPAPGLSDEARRALGDDGGEGRGGRRLRGRGHGGVRRRRIEGAHAGELLLHRDEHAAPGRASGDGGGDRHRPRRVAASRRIRRSRCRARRSEIAFSGHAIEARLYAEDPGADFRPSTGRLVDVVAAVRRRPSHRFRRRGGHDRRPLLRRDARQGDRRGCRPAEAMARLAAALGRIRIAGPKTNLAFLSAIVAAPEFRAGGVDTGFIDRALPKLRGRSARSGARGRGDRANAGARGGRIPRAARPGLGARTDALRAWRHAAGGPCVPVEIDGAPVVASISTGRRTGRRSSRSAASEPEYAADA